MGRTNPSHFLAVALVSIAVLSFARDVAAEDSSGFRYGISGNNQVFTERSAAEAGGVVTLTISGGREATIAVELIDIYADTSGSKRALPLNSNPYTPDGLVEFPAIAGEYVPASGSQKIDVEFRFTNIESLSRPVLGGLKISIVPRDESGDGLTVQSAIIATFGYYPSGLIGENAFAPSLTLSEVRLQRLSRDSFPFSLLPNVHRVFTDGPFQLDAKLSNSGNIFLDSQLNVSARTVGVFGGEDTTPIFQQTVTDQLLVPNQSTQVSFQVGGDTSAMENVRFPRFGFARFTIAAEGSIGGEQRTTVATTITVLFIPWKQLLIAMLAIVLLRRRIATLLRTSRSYLQDFKRFRERQSMASETVEDQTGRTTDE